MNADTLLLDMQELQKDIIKQLTKGQNIFIISLGGGPE